MKRSELQLNPFSGNEEFLAKKPEDMSIDELKMLLHIKRLNIKLNVERMKTNVNYYKLIFGTIKELGLAEKLENWLNKLLSPDVENSKTTIKDETPTPQEPLE
ncbi:MAG: hypothetical protein KDK90_19480 [Leptospiraceae bacterium]|nr:hypothetical protein [Leptospiraceae bacterium]